MKRLTYISAVAAAVMAVAGCQPEVDGARSALGRNAITFGASIEKGTDKDMTKAAPLCSADGCYEIPLWKVVTDGIGDFPETAGEGAVVTKGVQLNTTGSNQALATYASQIGGKFYVAAWDGTSRFIPKTVTSGTQPQYEEVSYSAENGWTSASTYKWKDDKSLTFYAYANLPATVEGEVEASIACGASTEQVLTYSVVPADATKQNDILMGYFTGTGDDNKDDSKKLKKADITFYHPLTAVRFRMGDISGTDIKFKAIYLSQIYKSGTATMTPASITATLPGDKFSWTNLSGEMQEARLEANADITSTDVLPVDAETSIIGEPFIIIPQNLESKPVQITIAVEIDGVLNALTTTCDSGVWAAGCTNTYTLSYAGTEPELILEVEGEVLTDYLGNGSKEYAVTSNAPWKIQYTLDGGTTWTDAAAGTQIDSWIKFDKVSGNGDDTVEATVAAAGETPTSLTSEHAAILKAATPKGTEDAPYDLSMHTIYGDPRAAGPVTANSYVINAPGWYAFPLVYGNAIDYNKVPSGGVNTQAFAPSGSGTNFLTPFKSTEGVITSPYITGATSAYPYWEDVPGYGLIALDGCTILNQSAAAEKGLTGCNSDYVVFQVSKSSLQQGNAVIAVSNGSYILWSWHIWVTDMDLTCRTVTNTGGTFSKGVMPLNLGWVDLGTSIGYERKKLQIRFVQIVDDEEKNEVGKNPERKEYVTESPAGQSPTYQWGRKDPFIRSKADGSELTATEYSGTGLTKDFASSTISTAIKNPAKFFSDGGTGGGGAWYGSGGDGKYDNLWSATIDVTTHGEGYASAPVKTIYDPCPPGFQVPQKDAFDRFADASSWGGWNNGFKLKTSASGNEYIFFPAAGYRIQSGSFQLLSFDHISQYWTVAPNDQDGNRKFSYYLFLSETSVNVAGNKKTETVYKTYGNSIRPVQETSGKY